jgi:hypothetical protein
LSPPRIDDLVASQPDRALSEVAPSRPLRPIERAATLATNQHEQTETPLQPRSEGASEPEWRSVSADQLRSPSLAGQPDVAADVPDPTAAANVGLVGPPQVSRAARGTEGYQVPEIYRLRVAPNRAQLAIQRGSTPKTEEAVRAALQWLADHQEPDGRWNPKKYGGGRETLEAGRDRLGAGGNAETGVTGLALLAFAAAGNTHLQGTHRETVRRGIQFLLVAQHSDGSLGGRGEMYEFMYCHGMATLALAELLGMSGDERLRQPVVRAVAYTLAGQDPEGGGWRYRAKEAGDTSQLGWQLMALKSAELAGIHVPEATWEGASRFLQSVSGGKQRGLASYRPGERMSRTMTAEALVCRQFLGLPPDSQAAREAASYLMEEMPGKGDANLYYWYYGTVAMYQLQGESWQQWTQALQRSLLDGQHQDGEFAGTWEPAGRWDGYGGRVYSTALATLCLEAYYRFMPLHAATALPGPALR